MSLNEKLILFGTQEAGVYLRTMIYDPDIDLDTPDASGKVVPAVGSIVIDDTTAEAAYAHYTVIAVNATTLKATLAPAHFLSTEDGGPDRIIGYGNDTYMLYYNDRVVPAELLVDNKLVIFGLNSANYRLVRTDVNGVETEISLVANGYITKYVYYRLLVTAASAVNLLAIGEFSLTIGGTKYVYSSADTFSGSSTFGNQSGSYPIPLAFNNLAPVTDNDCWHSSVAPTVSVPQWIQVQLPVAKLISSYTINPAPTSYALRSPKNWKLQGSQNGTTWVDIDVRNNVVWGSNSAKTFYPTFGAISGTKVPVVAIQGNTSIRKCSNCVTTSALTDNELITMQIFNQSNILTSTVKLICKRATSLLDQEISTKPITEFRVSSNQQDADGNWFLYSDQSTSQLAIHAALVYSDGTIYNVAQNNTNCFIYGLDDVDTLYPGMQYEVLVKYFISDLTPSLIAQGRTARYLSESRTLTIRNRALNGISKISIVPYWDVNIWKLRYFAYNLERNGYSIIPPASISYLGNQFNGSNITTTQYLTLNTTETLANGNTQVYSQSIKLQLKAAASATPFIYAEDDLSLFVYGSADLPHKRPLLKYSASTGQYSVDVKFASVEEFIENFYTASLPPYITEDESEAPTPTHFTIRNMATGTIILSSAIAIADYATAFNLITSGSTGQYANTTVVVEFLLKVGAVYTILYGVPVEVKS